MSDVIEPIKSPSTYQSPQESALRSCTPRISSMPELQCVRHFTKLSQKNFCIDTQTYPLGSCTMKYNPKAAHHIASLPGFNQIHPLTEPNDAQGALQSLYELQTYLINITGMQAASLTTMAGAQGEFAGVSMIKAYHAARDDHQRQEILVPDAAHGTNPASAIQCGYQVREIPTTASGDVDLNILQSVVGPQTAGIMLTNPSTLGVFEQNIEKIAEIIHAVGGLLYYDGANLNAILGHYRPGDMGFDVMHLNLHKTFATPHGGGGPGAGPVLAGDKLAPFLPTPIVGHSNGRWHWLTKEDRPLSIGRCTTFMGNTGVLLRAYAYIRLLGRQGLQRVSEVATLNANYLMHHLKRIGYTVAFPDRRASHEFIVTLKPEFDKFSIKALDVAKRLLDYGVHAPTIYFPIHVPECLLIEPTETESKVELDQFIQIMHEIFDDIHQQPTLLKSAPNHLALSRVDEVYAAKNLNLSDYMILNDNITER